MIAADQVARKTSSTAKLTVTLWAIDDPAIVTIKHRDTQFDAPCFDIASRPIDRNEAVKHW